MATSKKTKNKKAANKTTKSKSSSKAPKGKTKGKAKITAKVKVAAKPKAQSKVATKGKAKAKPQVKSQPKVSAKVPKAMTSVKSAAKMTAKSTTKPLSFEPMLDHILVQPAGVSDRTPGGLFIPATVQDKPLKGKVLAVGKGRYNKKGQLRPLDIQVGEAVLYGQYAGTPVTLNGEDFLILKEEDVLGVTA